MGQDVAGDLRVEGGVTIPERELKWRFSRSSGPGGQSVNTADSRVELRWAPATSDVLTTGQRERLVRRLGAEEIVVRSSTHRSQLQNRRAARERLSLVVGRAFAPAPPPRRRTKPTRGSVERRIAAKKRRSEVKRRRRQESD